MYFLIISCVIGFIAFLSFYFYFTLSKSREASGLVIGVFAFCICAVIGGVIGSSYNTIVIKDEITYHKIIVVNHYYVDDKLRVVTEDNLRLTFDESDAVTISETDVKSAPYIKRHVHEEMDWWGFPVNYKTYDVLLDWQYEKENPKSYSKSVMSLVDGLHLGDLND